MGRKREYYKPLTFRVDKNQYKKIIKDTKKNGNVGNVLRRIVDEHYKHKLFKLRIRNILTGFNNLIIGGIMMNKKIIAVLGIIVIAGMLFGLGMQPVVFQQGLEEHGYIDGFISVYHNGVLVDRHHNVLTDLGANGIRDYLSGGAGSAINYIAVGNGSDITTSSTSIPGGDITDCGFSRATGTLGIQGTGNWSFEKIYTSTCDGIVVNTSGMYNASSGDYMFWGDDFTDCTLQSSDTLKITWNISVS